MVCALPEARPEVCKVWLVTGATAGLGLALARSVLARGDKVIATGRSGSRFDELLSDSSIDQTRFRALTLDVTAPFGEIKRQVDTAIGAWGRIDVLVNNAGICYLGATEEIGSVRIDLSLHHPTAGDVPLVSQSRGNDAYHADELRRRSKRHECRPPTHA